MTGQSPQQLPTREGVLRAAEKIAAILPPTPLIEREIGGQRLWFKAECLLPIGAFKIRGAWHRLSDLDDAQQAAGVVAFSSGNHAQGIAWAARRLGISATIVMPTTTPAIKIQAVRNRGGEVVLAGESFSDAYVHAVELEKNEKLTFVHPYDDPDVIAGQGTIGMEILRQHGKPIHAIFCCVGGGGLLAGVAAYVKRVRPDIKVIGVQTVDSDAMTRSLAAGKRIELESVGLFADGAAVKLVGEETFRVCQEYVDEMIVVDNDAICAAIKDVFEDTRSILEPAGALSLAGAKEYAKRNHLKDKTLVAVASGANMNFDRLRFVAERAEIGEQREAVLAVTIPEKPGSFKKFCDLLGNRNITEFNYRYGDADKAHIFVGVGVHNRAEGVRITEMLQRHDLPCLDLTDDEMAKSHVRYMVGGHAPQAENEVLYRFVFPERPGALLNFLETLRSDWNISLFHYRNHGADFGRVLVGMQVPPADRDAFQGFLARLGYEYVEETYNPAYKMFLG